VLFETVGPKRNGALFARHLDELRRALRRYKKIHVICDNARYHKYGAVAQFLREHGDRVALHYLPRYSPDCNPVERVWWRLHEAVTRNHRCRTMDDLLELTFDWFETRTHFRVHSEVYTETARK
jgi:transposase